MGVDKGDIGDMGHIWRPWDSLLRKFLRKSGKLKVNVSWWRGWNRIWGNTESKQKIDMFKHVENLIEAQYIGHLK